MRILLYMRKYGILANRKLLMCIALAQTCLFHLLKHVFFGRMRGKQQNNISCRNDFFSCFLIQDVERIEDTAFLRRYKS